MIHYLVYLSSSTHLLSENELKEILEVSRRNNSAKDVTGILLYHDGNIIQVLEGDKEVIHTLYKKISTDNRHNNVTQMVQGSNAERSFSDWSMGFKSLTDSEWKEYQGYLHFNSSMLYSAIKKKNAKIDTTLKSFISSTMQ